MKKTKLIIAVFMVLSMLATASVLAFADDTTPLTLDQIIEKDLPAAENEEDDRVEIDFSQGELDSKWVSNVKDAYSIKDGVLEVSNSVSSMTIKYLPGTELASATKYVWSFDYKVVTFPSSSGELVCEFVSSDVRFLIYFMADGSVKIGYNSAETHNLGIKAGEWHNFTVTRNGNIFSFYIDGVYFTDIYNTKDSKPFEAAQAFGMHYISRPGVPGEETVEYSVDNIKYITYTKVETPVVPSDTDDTPRETEPKETEPKETEKSSDTEKSTATEAPKTETTSGSDTSNKKGCGSFVGGAGILVMTAAVISAGVITGKKKNRE